MNIQPFKPKNTDTVIALWQECGLIRPWNDPIKDIERKSRVQPELFLVGVQGDDVLASAMGGYDGHRGSVYYLAVSPRHQGKGLGAAIMADLEQRLLAMGCPKLNLMVRTGNTAASGFYDRLGYLVEESACRGKRLIPDF